MTGNCQKLLLAGPLESMRATQSDDYGVKSMTYLRNGRKKTFGKSGERIVEWTLTQSEPIIGIHGSFTGDRISSLGFITLDTACQVPFDQAPDVVLTEDEAMDTESLDINQGRDAIE